MKPKARFIKSIIGTATDITGKSGTELPWARGARRGAFIARRRAGAASRSRTRSA